MMQQTSPRIAKIAHWIGIVLAVPLLVIGLYLLYEYLRGGFPSTVTVKDAVLVLGFVLFSSATMYIAMRFAGFLVSQAISAFRK